MSTQIPVIHYQSGFRSAHTGGGNFLMADGAVKFIPETIQSAKYFTIPNSSGNPNFFLTSGTYPNLVQNTSVSPLASGVYQALSTRAGGEAVSPP